MPTKTRFVLLMHPKEYKREKAATGRLAHLCLAESELQMGIEFDQHPRVQEILHDPANLAVLLYPGRDALNLTDIDPADQRIIAFRTQTAQRKLIVFVLDATWALGRKMLKLSPSLQALPRIMFTPSTPSRYVIKQQPAAGCLSTIESIHELLLALQTAGLDRYPQPEQLLGLFDRMQAFQIHCATDDTRGGYRRHGYRAPGQRKPFSGQSAKRRAKLFELPCA
jgi:DTW domain-containing protein